MRTAVVLKHFGDNGAAVARILGIRKAAVYKWGDLVPPLRAQQLHRLTSGALRFDPAAYQNSPLRGQGELASALGASASRSIR